MKQPVDRNATIVRAREFRRKPTLPEGLLWHALRQRPGGLKFRRQHPIDWYIADFYSAAARLVVEVDGESHAMGDRAEHDRRRDAWLRWHGFYVVRCNAADVLNDLNAVVEEIVRLALSRLPLHQASPGPPPHDLVVGRN